MVAEKDIIIAFELGSSAIRGVAGKRSADGGVQILAIEQESIGGSIRRGTVYNINKTTSAILRIKERLNETLGVYIKRAYVGIAGQSLHTTSNKVIHTYETKEKITQEMIDALMDENRSMQYPDREILDIAPQEYHLGIDTTSDPIGIQSERIEGRYLNIIARNNLQEDIRTCMRDAGIEIVDLLITPIELAKALLPDSEKRSGCALVDIGAETTTVSIFTKNILRHLVTLPLGGKNVTNDIANLKKMELEEAEDLKVKYGVAQMTPEKNGAGRQIHISNDRTLTEEDLQYITSARYDEIVANVWNQINKGKWQNDLLSGITLTGGGASMKGLPEAFAQMKNFDLNKIKVAKQLITTLSHDSTVNTATPGFNAAIALLMSAKENCVGERPIETTVVSSEPEPVAPSVAPEPEAEKTAETPSQHKGIGFLKRTWSRLKDALNEDE